LQAFFKKGNAITSFFVGVFDGELCGLVNLIFELGEGFEKTVQLLGK